VLKGSKISKLVAFQGQHYERMGPTFLIQLHALINPHAQFIPLRFCVSVVSVYLHQPLQVVAKLTLPIYPRLHSSLSHPGNHASTKQKDNCLSTVSYTFGGKAKENHVF
jgi:hypothetical protein